MNGPGTERNGSDSSRPGRGEQPGLSRRAFMKGSGMAAAATALTRPLVEAAEQGAAADTAKVVGPGPVPITLTVNGQRHRLKLEPRVTLLDALRNHLDLTGAKRVCDRGTCGACTVIMDGRLVYACSVLAIDAEGKQIRTVESLGKDDRVVRAFVDKDAQQCGFCTPGFVMACTALLERHPNPSPEQVDKGLGGNLCRCGSYLGIKRAVLQAAAAQKGGAG